VRQDTGLLWAGNDFRTGPEGMERAQTFPERPPANKNDPSRVAYQVELQVQRQADGEKLLRTTKCTGELSLKK
jgi:hypothetical protein